MRRVSGAIKVIPVSATLLIVGVFAITGWPPFGVFVSEFTIVTAGFASGNIFPSVMFIGVVATIFIGFIYYAAQMVFGEPHRRIEESDGDTSSLVAIGALVALLFLLGVAIPSFLSDFIGRAVAIVQGY